MYIWGEAYRRNLCNEVFSSSMYLFFKVSLRIHTIKGFVHINGHKVDHTVVTSVHVRTIVGKLLNIKKQFHFCIYLYVYIDDIKNEKSIRHWPTWRNKSIYHKGATQLQNFLGLDNALNPARHILSQMTNPMPHR